MAGTRPGATDEGRRADVRCQADADADKALTRQFFQRISAGDLTAVDELVSDDYVEHEQVPGLAPG